MNYLHKIILNLKVHSKSRGKTKDQREQMYTHMRPNWKETKKMYYTIKEVSEKTGLSDHTLRYYEKAGLLTGVNRSPGGFRQYTEDDLEWLGLICCLKNTGMSLEEIAKFVELTHQGDQTLRERVALLEEHRENVKEKITQMQAYLDKVNAKLAHFSAKLTEYETKEGKT